MKNSEDFKVLDFDLFPVFEYISALSIRNTNPRKESASWSTLAVLHRFIKSLFLFIYIKRRQDIYVTSENNKVDIQGILHDRVVDPFIANKSVDSFLKLTFSPHTRSGKEKYRSNGNISGPIFLLRVLLRPFFRVHAKTVQTCWKHYVSSFYVKDEEQLLKINIFNIFCGLVSASYIFSMIFRRSGANRLFVSNPYSLETIGAIFAANRGGLETISLQHGVQTKEHFAFKFSKGAVVRGLNTLPKTYYLWDYYSVADIPSFSRVMVKGFWFHDYVKKMNIKVKRFFDQEFCSHILVTTQPSTGLLAKEVRLLARANLDSGIFLRLHPSQVSKESFSILDRYLGHMTNVEYRKASSMALPLLIPICNIHLTGFSSCIIETANLGVMSYTFSPKALDYYPEYVEAKKLEYLPEDVFWQKRWFP